MIRPTREGFARLARAHTVVPVWREVLADQATPVAGFARVVGDAPGFLFESVEGAERWSRFSFIGREPLATIVARGGQLTVTGDLPEAVPLHPRLPPPPHPPLPLHPPPPPPHPPPSP